LTRLLSENLRRQALVEMLHLEAGTTPEAEDHP
jgi:hypothetical protein